MEFSGFLCLFSQMYVSFLVDLNAALGVGRGSMGKVLLDNLVQVFILLFLVVAKPIAQRCLIKLIRLNFRL